MTSCTGTVKAGWDADLRQFQEARLCAARGAHKDGLDCNRGSTQANRWVTHPAWRQQLQCRVVAACWRVAPGAGAMDEADAEAQPAGSTN